MIREFNFFHVVANALHNIFPVANASPKSSSYSVTSTPVDVACWLLGKIKSHLDHTVRVYRSSMLFPRTQHIDPSQCINHSLNLEPYAPVIMLLCLPQVAFRGHEIKFVLKYVLSFICTQFYYKINIPIHFFHFTFQGCWSGANRLHTWLNNAESFQGYLVGCVNLTVHWSLLF